MFELRIASIKMRKACALRGVRTANWQPMHGGYDPTIDPYGDGEIIAKVHPARGEAFALTVAEVIEAGRYTWKEIIA